jgi:hypothetical protein
LGLGQAAVLSDRREAATERVAGQFHGQGTAPAIESRPARWRLVAAHPSPGSHHKTRFRGTHLPVSSVDNFGDRRQVRSAPPQTRLP